MSHLCTKKDILQRGRDEAEVKWGGGWRGEAGWLIEGGREIRGGKNLEEYVE